MARYMINMTQDVMAQVRVNFEIESDRPIEEIRAEYEKLAEKITRLGRFFNMEEELTTPEEYVEGTLQNELFYEGDDGYDVEFWMGDDEDEFDMEDEDEGFL